MQCTTVSRTTPALRWSIPRILELYALPMNDLLLRAQTEHRRHHQPNAVQRSSLLSIKTGACPEDCAYCPQSSRYTTPVQSQPLMALADVLAAARKARAGGAERFCMGAAWRSPTERQLDDVVEMVRGVKALGLETCVTLGMLKDGQPERLKSAGLDYYNHNLDTAREHYADIITTRSYEDRLHTLERVRTIAVARITMPKAVVRLSAGRETMHDSTQALCFMAGANSIFYGDQLLTTDNPDMDADARLFERLGLQASGTLQAGPDPILI